MDLNIIFPETYIAQAKRCWRRRKYKRLPSSIPSRRKLPVLKLGGQDPDHQRHWKLKSAHKLKLKAFVSPAKLLVKFREAYINTMLRWSTKMGIGRVSFNLKKRNHKHAHATIAVNGQQVDPRLVMAIYHRMVADREHRQTPAAQILV